MTASLNISKISGEISLPRGPFILDFSAQKFSVYLFQNNNFYRSDSLETLNHFSAFLSYWKPSKFNVSHPLVKNKL